MEFGQDGNLYVCSWDDGQIVRLNGTTGAFIDVFVSGLSSPAYLTFAPVVADAETIPEPMSIILVLLGTSFCCVKAKTKSNS